jgi:hypothetical protein
MVYVKVKDGKIVSRSVNPVINSISSPKKEHFLAAGWVPLEREKVDGRVVRWDTEIQKDKVVEKPITLVDELPTVEEWQDYKKDGREEIDGRIIQKYRIATHPLNIYKSRKKRENQERAFSSLQSRYDVQTQLLGLFKLLDKRTESTLLEDIKYVDKEIKEYNKLVDGADSHEEVYAIKRFSWPAEEDEL